MQDATAFKEQRESQEQQWQKLVSDANAIEEQERKQVEQQQKLNLDAKSLGEQEQKQAHQRQKLTLRGKAPKEQRQQQKQKLAQDTSVFREQQSMNKRRLSSSSQADIPGLAAGQARQAEARQSQEQEDHLQKTRNRMGQAQTDQPQGSRKQAQENRAAKRQQEDEVSDDSIACQAPEIQQGRKLMENNKYQRLNRYEWSRRDVNLYNTLRADNINQEDTTPITRKHPRRPLPQQQQRQQQQKWNVQQQKRAMDATVIPPTGNSRTN